MTDEESKDEFEKQVRERVEGLRKAFAPVTQRLVSSDEPAPVFAPQADPHQS